MRHERKRSEAVGVVTRKLAGDLIVKTVFGANVPNMVRCECGVRKFKSEFYLESSSRRKHPWQVRFQCVNCWDAAHGKKQMEEYKPTNTIEHYFSEDQSNA